MASTAQPSNPSISKSALNTPSIFRKSPSRVFLDVDVPRHRGPRVSLADIDPDASKAFQNASKSSFRSAKKDEKANDASSRALQPTTRTNSSGSVKRGREEEQDENEGMKKRKVEGDGGKIQASIGKGKTASKPRRAAVPPKKQTLDTPTVAPATVAASEVPVKKVVVKKPQPEPQPLWTRVGADFTREEIEDRILLREFTIRFNQCLGLKRLVLEKLEDFGEFDDATAKALLLAIIEFLGKNSPSDERRVLADFTKQLRARGMSFYDILHTMDHKLRNSTTLHIPNLTTVLNKKERDVDSTALIPVILFLIDNVLETDDARKEIDRWKEEAAEVRRTYFRAMKEEKEHWGPIRTKLMDEKKAGGAGFDAAKWKKKLEAAKAKHESTEHALKFTLIKQLAEIAPRFTPLTDTDGRTYYFHTPSLRKPPAKSTRDDFGKWTWFVAVWGSQPTSAKRVDKGEEDAGKPESSSSSLTESEDEISGAKEEREGRRAGQEGWWGFGDAAELRLLAKWIQWRDQEAGAANASAGGSTDGDGDGDGTPDAEEDEETKPKDGSKRLVSAILDFASVLEYADDVVAK